MQFVCLPHLFLLPSVISCLISVTRWIQELDHRIVTWAQASLADSMKKVYAVGLQLYQGLMDQLGMVPWPWDRVQLGRNLARFVVHLAAKRLLQVLTICSYLAGVRLELLDRGLDQRLTVSEQLQILLTVVKCNVGKAQHRKGPITMALLCQFVILLPTAPFEVQLAWGPIVNGPPDQARPWM